MWTCLTLFQTLDIQTCNNIVNMELLELPSVYDELLSLYCFAGIFNDYTRTSVVTSSRRVHVAHINM